MKKLPQTRLDNFGRRSNAYITCVACFLNMDSAEDALQIQELFDENGWTEKLMEWLVLEHDMALVAQKDEPTSGYYIVTGKSAKNIDLTHHVIYKDGELWHDPDPMQKGLVDHLYYERMITVDQFRAEQNPLKKV